MSARLEPKANQVLITQDAFRVLMDCLARPGKINWLVDPGFTPPPGLSPYSVLILITLLDGETSFTVLPFHDPWIEYIQHNTGARISNVPGAEYVLVDGSEDIPDIDKVNRGDLLSPEKGATLLFQVDKIEESPGAASTGIKLQGPGVKGTRDVYISGMGSSHWPRLKQLNREYPLGVDLFIVALDGRVIGIPRSSIFTWEVIG